MTRASLLRPGAPEARDHGLRDERVHGREGHERVVEEHREQDGHEELYFVASGPRDFFVLLCWATMRSTHPPGRCVHAEPGTKRGAVATEPKTAVLAIGAKPGVPYEISATTPRDKWIDVDDQLAAELSDRLAKLGYEGNARGYVHAWTGKENLEDRVDGSSRSILSFSRH